MTIKDKVLKIFITSPDTVFSGEDLAKELNASRAAVWKAVHALQEEGHHIESSAKGYRYLSENDILNRDSILSCMPEAYDLILFDVIDSTNTYCRAHASELQHGCLVVANHQTAGRGRRGHTFFSPADTGLYLTLVLKPQEAVQNLLMVTVAAAVAACQAVRETSDTLPEIKWVNDLYIGKRKIAGILTEAIADLETQQVDTLLIGIGFNTKKTELPDDIKGIAGAINDSSLSRNRLAAAVWKNLLYWTEHLSDPALIEKYREYSLLIGHEITYEKNGKAYTGTVLSINDAGNLVIASDGEEIILSSGEVSVKDW